ncbi:MAG: carbohydrate kinase family protein [Caldilineaceae bacterium]
MAESSDWKIDLLVIGGAALDVLHNGAVVSRAPGGAGMYTASAAWRAGASVVMLAPRPQPMPEVLAPFAQRVTWRGRTIPPSELPHFEIAHQDGATTYLSAYFGAEAEMMPADLPDDLSQVSYVHVVPLGSVARQLAFVQACRARGARCISAGAFVNGADEDGAHMDQVFAAADLMFMNEEEATAFFGSLAAARTAAGKLLFVTRGSRGARILQGDAATDIGAPTVDAVDVTGAGDAFCGATLTQLARGRHPVLAARYATALAAEMIQAVGPSRLWAGVGTPPALSAAETPAVAINPAQIERVAALIAQLPEVQPYNFTGPQQPPVDHPAALECFFALTLQQFGFWEAVDGVYDRPMIAPIGGELRKGSDYLAYAYLRTLHANSALFSPPRQAALTRTELLTMLRADDGGDPMPALDLHLAQARAYGRDMLALGWTPQAVLDRANASAEPLATFLQSLMQIGGYKEDPLQKKSALLAIILSERPEHFLRPAVHEVMPPIIDYHLMRSCLRTGLIDVRNADLRRALAARRLVEPAAEWAVRNAAYEAIAQVAALAGQGMAAVDAFFFQARRRCPEMSEPECGACAIEAVCMQRKELFQPVLRTVFY